MARATPKVHSGGRRAANQNPWATAFARSTTPPTQNGQSAPQTQNANGIDIDDDNNGLKNPSFEEFKQMTDDEKAAFIAQALKQAPPSFIPDNDLQRVVYAMGGDNHPTIVTDQQLDAIRGADLYRQVAGVKTQFGDLSSEDIVNQIMLGDHTLYSDSGGSAHGKAIYFGKSYSEIRQWYGVSNTNYVRGGGRDSTIFRVKINPKSRGISESSLTQAVDAEIRSGSQLGRVLSRVNHSSRNGVYALSKGYDYSYDYGRDYHMVYNRECIIASSRTKHNASDSSW